MDGSRISRRELLIGAGAGMLLPLPALARARSAPPPGETVRFGVIADVHQDVMHDGERRLRAFLDAMEAARPDFVLQLGDFCVPHPRNDAFLAAWNAFAGPRHHVIGNHEMDGGYTREQVVEHFGMPDRFYSFDRSGVHFVVLDGNDPGGTSGGYPRFVADDQIGWLQDDLAATDRPTLVFVHQPLDSDHGVDNRAAVRAILERASRTPGQADVVAVLAGHSHLDYCRLVNGIYYALINSASYQWVGGAYRHASYPAEVHEAAKWLDHTCPYRDPLWALVELDPKRGTLAIEGRATRWVGPSPAELGANGWDADPRFCRPEISSWRLPLRGGGELPGADR